jgi:demethylmenaquinone methyltransferase/2-methoxy-6-polyprenyl-1,4-benzoquinol methylase
VSVLPPEILAHQIAYYRARATEYDEWFLRLGRYDRGEAWNAEWFREVAELEDRVAQFHATGDVLELACGTGWWTERLARTAATLTAVDAAPEVLALNRRRLGDQPISYVQADMFAWEPAGAYDVVFFSFWLSHVPPERFDAFWALVGRAIRPGGRVYFIDSYQPASAEADSLISRRELNDGRQFEIVKIFYQPEQLQGRLRALGWDVTVARTAQHFLYGSGRRRD